MENFDELTKYEEDIPSKWEHGARELFETFIKNKSAKLTKRSYFFELAWFFDDLSLDGVICEEMILGVKSKDVISYKNELTKKGLGARTICRKISTISSFYGYLAKEGKVKKNPCSNVDRPKIIKEVVTPDFSNEEVAAILESIDTQKVTGALHKAILTTLFYMGLRCGELVNLKISSLCKQKGVYCLSYQAKGEQVLRYLPLSDAVTSTIGEYLEKRGNLRQVEDVGEYLFLSYINIKKGINKPINESSIRYMLGRYAKKVGIDHKYSIHSTRATFIGASLDQGVDIHKVADWVNHSDINLTKLYSKRRDRIKLKDQLEGIYG